MFICYSYFFILYSILFLSVFLPYVFFCILKILIIKDNFCSLLHGRAVVLRTEGTIELVLLLLDVQIEAVHLLRNFLSGILQNLKRNISTLIL